jgi:hypothetical protein
MKYTEQHIKEYARQLILKSVIQTGLPISMDMKVLLESIIIENSKYFYKLGLEENSQLSRTKENITKTN